MNEETKNNVDETVPPESAEVIYNKRYYNQICKTPESAIKKITGGRLKGKSDINPMWRIKMLTEMFGPCGIGWYTDNIKYELVDGGLTKEVAVKCELDLFYKENGEWSKPVHGVGGNKFIVAEAEGLHCNDDAHKSAYTDALSIAYKALGGSADIYYEADNTKYGAWSADGNSKGKAPAKNEKTKDLRAAFAEWFKSAPDGQINTYIKKAIANVNKAAKNPDAFDMARHDLLANNLVPAKSATEMTPDELADLICRAAEYHNVKITAPSPNKFFEAVGK